MGAAKVMGELVFSRRSDGTARGREPATQHQDLHGRYRVRRGPTTFVKASGIRFHASKARRIFGLDGLRSGMRLPSMRMYWYGSGTGSNPQCRLKWYDPVPSRLRPKSNVPKPVAAARQSSSQYMKSFTE